MADLGRSDPGLESLAARVTELERVHAVGDADRPLTFEETVRCATTRSTSTVRSWWKRPATRAAYRLDLLFTKDATGHLVSTPRRVAAWQRACAAKWNATENSTAARVRGGQKESNRGNDSTPA